MPTKKRERKENVLMKQTVKSLQGTLSSLTNQVAVMSLNAHKNVGKKIKRRK